MKRYTPPNPYTTPPLEMFARMSDWRMQVVSYIIHLADAGELIEQNNNFYINSQELEDLHPQAISLLRGEDGHRGVIDSHAVTLTVPSVDGRTTQVTAYPVNIREARNFVSSHARAHQFSQGVKNVANYVWNQAATPRLGKDPSTMMYNH